MKTLALVALFCFASMLTPTIASAKCTNCPTSPWVANPPPPEGTEWKFTRNLPPDWPNTAGVPAGWDQMANFCMSSGAYGLCHPLTYGKCIGAVPTSDTTTPNTWYTYQASDPEYSISNPRVTQIHNRTKKVKFTYCTSRAIPNDPNSACASWGNYEKCNNNEESVTTCSTSGQCVP